VFFIRSVDWRAVIVSSNILKINLFFVFTTLAGAVGTVTDE